MTKKPNMFTTINTTRSKHWVYENVGKLCSRDSSTLRTPKFGLFRVNSWKRWALRVDFGSELAFSEFFLANMARKTWEHSNFQCCPENLQGMSRNGTGNFLECSRMFDEYFLSVRETSCPVPGILPGISWKCPEHFLEVSRTFPRNFPVMSWTFPGNVLNISWTSPEISWTCPGNFLDLSWKSV